MPATPERPADPLHSRWVTVGGLRIHARVALRPRPGTAPVVLVHGQVVSSLYMVPTARLLAPHYRVLAPDLPGFGRSDKPRRVLTVPELADALASWMDAMQLPSAVLVGNSAGCQVAVDLAVRAPARVEGLVLAGPTMDPGAGAVRHFLRWVADWPFERPSLALVHLVDFLRAGPRRTLLTYRNNLADRIERKLPLVPAPALVVRGSRDPIVPPSWAAAAAALLPRGELAVVPGGPHCVNYSTPDVFAALVRRFVETRVARPPR